MSRVITSPHLFARWPRCHLHNEIHNSPFSFSFLTFGNMRFNVRRKQSTGFTQKRYKLRHGIFLTHVTEALPSQSAHSHILVKAQARWWTPHSRKHFLYDSHTKHLFTWTKTILFHKTSGMCKSKYGNSTPPTYLRCKFWTEQVNLNVTLLKCMPLSL